MPAMAGASAENVGAAGAAAGAPIGTPLAICLVRISVALRTVVFTKKSGPGAGAYTAAGMLVEAANNMTLEGASLVKVLWLEDWLPGLAWPQDYRHIIFAYNIDVAPIGIRTKRTFMNNLILRRCNGHGSPAYGIPDESWSPCEDAPALPGCERALILRVLPLMILVFRNDSVPADRAGTGAMAGESAAEAVTCRRHCK